MHEDSFYSDPDDRKAEPLHLLVIDDEPDLTELLSLFFTHKGFRVTTAQSESAARARLEETQFDLVVTDWNLAGTLALDIINTINALDSRIPIIVFSGADDPEDLLARTLAGRVAAILRKNGGLELLAMEVSKRLLKKLKAR